MSGMVIVLGVLLALAGVWVWIAIRNALNGENLLRDHWDQFRLARRTVKEWDRFWSENPCRSDIIITLTTMPSRIGKIERTIKSLLYQQRRPERILLHIPWQSRREQCGYEIPEFLQRLKALEIIRCADEGPATKVLPALFALPSTQSILVVDDDRIYPPSLVEDFHQCAQAHPEWAIGAAGWIVPEDVTDRCLNFWRNLRQIPPAPMKSTRIRKLRQVNILEGYAGYLVKPMFFDLAGMRDYSGAPEAAFYVDDVWISAHCQVPRYVFPARRHVFSYWWPYPADMDALCRLNDGGGDPEKRNNTILIRHFRDRWERLYS